MLCSREPLRDTHGATKLGASQKNAAAITNARFGEAALQLAAEAERRLRAEHVDYPDVVAVALRLSHPRPRTVWRCTIDGPLCEGPVGARARAELQQEARLRLRVSLPR